MAIDRREFLKRGIAFVAAGSVMPAVFVRAAYATDNNGSASASTNSNRTLVVLQMAGGNDGFNTVIPYTDPNYARLRPTLGIAASSVLDLDGKLGLHPSLAGLKTLYDRGRVAIVNGVGYPQANLSHFRSMQIWHTAEPVASRFTGWIGGYLDETANESNSLWRAVNVGSSLPISLLSNGSFVPAISSIASYQLTTDTKYPKDHANKLHAWAALYADAASEPGLAAFVGNAGSQAYTSSVELQSIAGSYTPMATYPANALASALKLAAQLITSSLGTGVIYITTGGFDTHSQELADHAALMSILGGSLAAFYADIEAHGKANDTLLMTWSEFGRRPAQNASIGSDHGTAGPQFVLGGAVKGGLYGGYPSLTSLDASGNFVFTTDFRQTYATVLEDWLGADSKPVLGATFTKLGFVAAGTVPTPAPGGTGPQPAPPFGSPGRAGLTPRGVIPGIASR